MAFWIIALGASLLTAAWVALPLLRRASAAAPRAAHDAQVFRDQLKELERDVARGTVTADDAEATRIEISRRLLAADAEVRKAEGAHAAPRGLSRALAVIVIVAAPLGALGLYYEVGAPGAQDQPLAQRGAPGRPSQEEAERMLAGRERPAPPAGEEVAEFERLVDQLEDRLAERPDDAQGVFLYARSLMNLGRFDEAYRQFQRLLELRPGDAEIYAGLSEGMILAAGGYISPEAEENLLEVLKFDPSNPSARYYLGRLHIQNGDIEIARAVWERLLSDSPPDAPWVPPIRMELAALSGQDGAPVLRGPTQEEMAAAADLPEADRQAMVRDMVQGLADRLAAEGGTVEEWQRLIRSYNVMGQPRRAREAMEAARAAFADDPAALSRLESGGPGAALAPPPAGGAPAPGPGPSAEDMAAAAEMPAADRAAMIAGMVQRLDDRLAAEGGTVEEWLRLISSRAALGEAEAARGAYERARTAFAGDAAALGTLEAAVEGAPRAGAPAAPPAAPPAGAVGPGPTQADIAAASEMSADDRQAMIRGMVANLHERLREEGRVADVNEWGKLMRSYGVLGQMDEVRAAYEEAVAIYDDDAIGKAYLKEAALLAGAELE